MYTSILNKLITLDVFFFFVSCTDEKQIQSLKDQINRNHMEFMMANIKLEQMKKLTDNECEKVYTLSQQRQELTEVRFTTRIIL